MGTQEEPSWDTELLFAFEILVWQFLLYREATAALRWGTRRGEEMKSKQLFSHLTKFVSIRKLQLSSLFLLLTSSKDTIFS